jgi:2-polyprenyl-3-methyl-5-hydroxy-6-metoxy-1,4-benzoquinol methylase
MVDSYIPTKTVRDRFDIIRQFIDGRSVLDLGVVDSRPAKGPAGHRIRRSPDLLFRKIAEANPDTVGVDIDAEGVEVLREMGYTVQCADVQTMNLQKQFDTIIAGELIEHLENPGQFLRNMARHLRKDGVLFITTPNPFHARQTWKIWRYLRPAIHEDHTCWFDPVTLSHLLRRCGLEPFDGYWIQPRPELLKAWRRLLRRYFSHSFMLLARVQTE